MDFRFRLRRCINLACVICVGLLSATVVSFVLDPWRQRTLRSLGSSDVWRKLPASQASGALWALPRRSGRSCATGKLEILQEVGSGSYGTVHLIQLQGHDISGDEKTLFVGKRAWTEEDLIRMQWNSSNIKDHAKRCRVYWETEVHCFRKMQKSNVSSGLPFLRDILTDEDGFDWMVFDMISSSENKQEPAKSLQVWMERDRKDHLRDGAHHLILLSSVLGLGRSSSEKESSADDDLADEFSSLAETIDVVFEGLLEILAAIHSESIVHRDVKPSNILISSGSDGKSKLHLIDFGSAADLDTAGPLGKNIGLSERVAISPIYAAPEIFIESGRRHSALKFDCFSLGLIICQLLFQYLDERTDAGFHQQLQVAQWDLNTWLATELAAKVRPAGLDAALRVLSQRPGLWSLLQDMLRRDPWERIDSQTALIRTRQIIQQSKDIVDDVDSSLIAACDGQFLADVLESLEYCTLPEESSFMVRPLHFVATFKRREPFGLLLAELDGSDSASDFADDASRQKWQRATADGIRGEVYVKGIVPGGQAESLGIFEVGDRLQGIGELPVAEQGFERVVQMIQKDTSPDPKYITLHFDRKSYATTRVPPSLSNGIMEDVGRSGSIKRQGLRVESPESSPLAISSGSDSKSSTLSVVLMEKQIQVVDQGAWSTRGRRKSQEDRFLLHELHDAGGRSIILAGVLDGHLGTAAANTVAQELPLLMSEALFMPPTRLRKSATDRIDVLLSSSWEKVCDLYRSQCNLNDDDDGTCRVADYDAREGILDANTGASDVVAGTTANLVALDERSGQLAVLNCGDSRSFVLDGDNVVFETVDHKPDREFDRFLQAQTSETGSLYMTPRCRFSRWYVPVGDYEYAVSRSLEGPFANARGIVSDPDVTVFQAEPGTSIVIATDGLWEIMDTAEVAKIVRSLRFHQLKSAADTAKILCSMAIERGSSDNVSAVILFLN